MSLIEQFDDYVGELSIGKLGLASILSGSTSFLASLITLDGIAEIAKNIGIIITAMVAIYTGCKFFVKEANELIKSHKNKNQ